MASHSPPPGRGRRRRHGDDGHHGTKAGGTESRGEGGSAPCGARQHAGRARLHRRRSQHRRLQRTLQRHVRGTTGVASARPFLSRFLRYLAGNGYYGTGDVDALVAERVESLRNPSGRSFEDHAPDGRWLRIRRRRAAVGGAVTVMTDITEQKQAERELVEAKQRTEEANKLVIEKNRVLEGLYAELQDKNRQVEEQAAELAEWNTTLESRVAEQVSQIGRYSRLTRFLSPKISDLIMSGETDDALKTRRAEITVVYVDLRGFTGFTETAEPEEVMSVLRQYHAELGRLVVEYDGTIEHIAGDGMMVLFNAPMPVENHELQAIRMALAMRESLTALSLSWRKRG